MHPGSHQLSCFPAQSVKISSSDQNSIIPTQFLPCSAHLSVDLDFSSTAIDSTSSSQFLTAATISAQDFSVFTTESQSIWLPNSQPSQPALSAQSHQSPVENQQDFVLFDNLPPRQVLSRSRESLSGLRRHSHQNRKDKLDTPAAQNQRLSPATGHTTSSALSNVNRFTNSFYASSAPVSSVSLSKKQQKNCSARPPVPLFNEENIGGVDQFVPKMMNAADVDLDNFTFEGGAFTALSSPALPSAVDLGGSLSGSSSTLGTVSPHDLFIQDPVASAPNSAALTNLTSPSIYESPEFDGYDVSPNFDLSPNFGNIGSDASHDSWYSLFPQDPKPAHPAPVDPEVPVADTSDDLGSLDPPSEVRHHDNDTSSPAGGGRHSSVAGVNARKRDKPLPPIVVDDPNDNVAMKRARNTLAARKSRERKAQRLEELEDRIAKLEAERDHWKTLALSQSDAQ